VRPLAASPLGVDRRNGQRGLLQHVQQHAHGVEAGEQGDVVLGGALADLHAVGEGAGGIDVPGVDDIGDVPLPHGFYDLV